MKPFAVRGAPVAALALAAAAASLPLAAHAADLAAVNEAAHAAAQGAGLASGVGSAVPALGFGAILQTLFGLAIVLGVVFGCAWLARRLGLQGIQRNALVKTIGGASLGGKERVSVVEIGDTWLVLGTAPGNVRLLHTMPAGAVPDAASFPPAGPEGSFGQRLARALKDEAGKRFRRDDGGAQ